jgi:hypothetical protein
LKGKEFVPKRVESNWKLEKVASLFYCSRNVTWVIKLRWMIWAVVACKEKINAIRLFVRKPEEEGTLGRPRLSWNCNIRMDLTK